MNVGAIGMLCGTTIGLGLACGVAAFRVEPPTRRLRLGRRITLAGLRGRSRKLAACIGAGVVTGLITGWPVAALAGGLATWWLPALLGPDRSTARELARTEAVATFTEMLRDTLSAASGIGQAVRSSCAAAPEAIAVEACGLARRIEDQQDLAVALAAFADELHDPTADIIVVCLVHAIRNSAQDLAGLLGSLAITARTHAAQRNRAQAARVQVRTSVRIVTCVTAGMLAGLFVLDRSFLSPYGSASGQFVLACGLALFAAGYAWLWRMAKPRTRRRLLTRIDQVQENPSWW
jgi:tight adherence protein B